MQDNLFLSQKQEVLIQELESNIDSLDRLRIFVETLIKINNREKLVKNEKTNN